ncbi:MFS transporter [Paraburkholderia caribensis]|uniref:MFS transporter n=1 Tax=Paraburkholderia caribensis TaxID=75105 RepID=A0A9Q6S4P9_9BURK|nr:MFS transporter [Paraburkholderia caribensis]AMV45410.1 proline/betaine transporter [Paraburkholderia caribensis]MCO4883017.1 MFS transporter [Paraburkholderia caribensis]MDR6386568.1 MFS family permease [Paraburkholderia caribensis]PTB28018.1 MFS transporter [Paraburkholderia caribensis]QLB64079.1 proline/betaine transporter [Paraburkholderia caribensis]
MLDDTLSLPSASLAARQRWTIFVASTGGALEVFDFVIYGFFAQHIGRAFFPPGIGLAPATLSFAVLAIGHLSRPLGGLFLGRLGDKYGRRIVFMSSALVAALATLAIGMLPSYPALGVAAPVALLALRLVQGLCLGGELPGALVYAIETGSAHPGLMCGFVFVAVNLSLLLASSVNLAVHLLLDAAQIDAFGWRIAFLLGGICGLGIFALRRTIDESAEYARAIARRHREPLAVLFRHHLAAIVTGIGAGVMTGVTGGLFIAYMPSWLQAVGHVASDVAWAQTLYVIAIAACIPFTAAAGDRFSRRRVFRVGAVMAALLAPVFFVAASRPHANLVLLFFIAGAIASLINGTYGCAIAELFPVDVRFSGVAAAMNVGLAVTMGLTPLVVSFLVADLHWTLAPALAMLAGALVAFASTFGMKHGRVRAPMVRHE